MKTNANINPMVKQQPKQLMIVDIGTRKGGTWNKVKKTEEITMAQIRGIFGFNFEIIKPRKKLSSQGPMMKN